MNARAYKDDAQIVEARVSRRWAARGERERVVVSVASAAGGVHVLGGERAA